MTVLWKVTNKFCILTFPKFFLNFLLNLELNR